MTSVSYAVPLLDEPVSPELALVDPELAARLRAVMPVPDIELEPRETNVRHLRLTPAPMEEPIAASVGAVASPPAPPSRESFKRLVTAFLAGAVAATLVTVGVIGQIGESELPRESSPVSVPPVLPQPSLKAPTPAKPTSKPKASKPAKSKSKPNTQATAKKSVTRSAKPAKGKAAAPAAEPRRFAWAPVNGAVGYRVELFRGDEQVLRATTKTPTFELGSQWRHAGHVERLTPGSYRWYVWPVLRGGAADKAVVQAQLSVP